MVLYLRAREKTYALHIAAEKFPLYCIWNSSNVGLTDDDL